MRRLKLQMQVSLDGFVGGPKGELDWMVSNWDEELNNYVRELSEPVDNILLGRKLAEGFIPYWSKAASNPEHPEFAAAKKLDSVAKIVFSRTLQDSKWVNTKLAKGNLIEEVNNLKKQTGKDIIVYGGAEFVSSLIRFKLIDDYHIFLDPVAIGKGLSIFGELDDKLQLTLAKTKSFECGIVVLHYQPR